MGTVSVSLPSDGQTIDAADYNVPINTIIGEINGNLDADNLANDAVTAPKINFGGAGVGVWWEEIARTTLAGAGDTISVTGIPARKYLQIRIAALATGGTINVAVTFNNDTGNNYAVDRSSDFGASSAVNTQANISLSADTTAVSRSVLLELPGGNVAAIEKVGFGHEMHSATGAGNAPTHRDVYFKWANTSAQITRVDATNSGTGDFAIGSEVVVLGHD